MLFYVIMKPVPRVVLKSEDPTSTAEKWRRHLVYLRETGSHLTSLRRKQSTDTDTDMKEKLYEMPRKANCWELHCTVHRQQTEFLFSASAEFN
jgi:hypothetical protein